MDILHYINILIGFSLVMFVLSSVVGSTAQAMLIIFRTKARAVGNGLVNLLLEFELTKDESIAQVTSLFNYESSDPKKGVGALINFAKKIIDKILFYINSPKNISREEFLLELLRKATKDENLAKNLGLTDKTDASNKLKEIEENIIKNEAASPSSPAYLWTTTAMAKSIPGLAGKLFSRFDNLMERADDKVSKAGKRWSFVVALPLLLGYCPIDSLDLISRLNSDRILSETIATQADGFIKVEYKKAVDELDECEKKPTPDSCQEKRDKLSQVIESENKKLSKLLNTDLFAHYQPECKELTFDCFIKNFKKTNFTFGILLTWIFVSMGSAFWLGLLNKMLGIRSEFSKKLADQRESRVTQQNELNAIQQTQPNAKQ